MVLLVKKRKEYTANVSDETGYGPGKVVEIILKFMAVIQAKLPSISKVNNWSDSATNQYRNKIFSIIRYHINMVCRAIL